jgi:LacI family gluconate utilization system Gnt-I transcriptional repressor
MIPAGREAAARLMQRHPEVTAVFCSNDLLAIGVLMHCRAQGWPVPQRLAVVGFSDLPVAEAVTPALTTMRIDAPGIGRRAAQMLLARFAGRTPAARDKVADLGFSLVRRDSA